MTFFSSAFTSAKGLYSQASSSFSNFTSASPIKKIQEVAGQIDTSSVASTLSGVGSAAKQIASSAVGNIAGTLQRAGAAVTSMLPGPLKNLLGKAGIGGTTEDDKNVSVNGGTLMSADFAAQLAKYVEAKTTRDEFMGMLVANTSSGKSVIFIESTPSISDTRSVEWDEFQAVHSPGGVPIYNKTKSREFKLSWQLVSRNQDEATINLSILTEIRRWAMPDFGTRHFLNRKGSPPPIIEFSLYGENHFKDVPCVMTSYSFNYPDDVDYIPCSDLTPFPILATIEVSLREAWSTNELSGISGKETDHLYAYRTKNYILSKASESKDSAMQTAKTIESNSLPSTSFLNKNTDRLSSDAVGKFMTLGTGKLPKISPATISSAGITAKVPVQASVENAFSPLKQQALTGDKFRSAAIDSVMKPKGSTIDPSGMMMGL